MCARGRGSASPTDAAVACDDDFDTVARAVAERLLESGGDIVVLLTGDEAPDVGPLEAWLAETHPLATVEVHPGGQPHYPLLLSVE